MSYLILTGTSAWFGLLLSGISIVVNGRIEHPSCTFVFLSMSEILYCIGHRTGYSSESYIKRNYPALHVFINLMRR